MRLLKLLSALLLGLAPLAVSPVAEAARLLFSNNASTTVATAISSTATSVTVAAGTGALFPSITATGQHWRGTFEKSGDTSHCAAAGQCEIVVVTATSTDTFTITRAQEGTTALSWAVGDFFYLLPTAGDLAEFVQFDDLQSQLGNYAVDSGSANAYSVTLSPALLGHVTGMPIRVKFANTNTGASTFNDGAGTLALVTPDLQALQAGNIQGSGVGVVVYDGTRFELLGTYKATFSQVGGQIGTAQVPVSAVTQYTAQILSSAALTGTPTAPTAATGTSNTQIASTAFANPGSSLSANGFYKLPGGLIVEWGTVHFSGTNVTASFNTPFPTACVGIWLAAINSSNQIYPSSAPSATSYSIAGGSSGLNVFWEALGY